MVIAEKAPLLRNSKPWCFLGRTDNNVDAMIIVAKDVCLHDVEPDGLTFDPTTVKGERITEDVDYEGVRLRLLGKLGTALITLQIDIGFGDVVIPAAKLIDYPTILELPAPRLYGYSRESAIVKR